VLAADPEFLEEQRRSCGERPPAKVPSAERNEINRGTQPKEARPCMKIESKKASS
jgi:hypothetical protein